MKVEDQILSSLDSLILQYKAELDFIQNRNMDRFDTTVLPQIMQDIVKLAVAKTPSFSNISAVAVANFVLSHMFGMLRPKINDSVYSDDTIGINTYTIIIARSGMGKDSTYQALTKASFQASEYIRELALTEAEKTARTKYIRAASKGLKDFDESTVTQDDYEEFIKPPEIPITSLSSSRGGLTTSMNRMAKSHFGTKSLFASELALAIQSNPAIVDVLELYSILYDMGKCVAPEFKSEDAKEESVSDMFPNLLGISSPAPFYQEGNVRKLLIPMLTTSLARRVTIVYSSASEEFENEHIAATPAEKRQIQAEQRVILREYTDSINIQLLAAAKTVQEYRTVMFNDEAAIIYDDYKSYTQELSKSLLLRDGDSVEGIEMSGRAFKMARIAAVWAMASNTQYITADILKAAIYFCDYTAQHLTKFTETLKLKDYELFINDWKQGFFDNVLPLDKAITKGYINIKNITQQALTNFLKPVNSRLQGIATVSYNETTNVFVFVPVVKNTENTYTYRANPGHIDKSLVNNIATDKLIDSLGQLLSVNSSFNPFATDTTKFVVIQAVDSFLSANMINKYLSTVHHFIAPTEHDHTFTILIPVNMVISRSEYKYVAMTIANQLMLKLPPQLCESDTVYNGFAGTTVLQADVNAALYDISGILGSHASGIAVPLLSAKPDIKPTSAVIAKYLQSEILNNQPIIVDMLNASSNSLLLFANLVHDMMIHGVDQQKAITTVDSTNASLDTSFAESIITEYLIEPFYGL